ncbi:SagB/ThcOx family dehydrogenase [Neolewinella lacunae]|uniref:SagB/ThcOx family dehydrogenase n=1 Tax=Neolewinella lacunae TaxID=1517758 RepID=A0A923PH92_9BACT|nr:SagB/ThcOx family dehydrogenase [Neolewinella lacunae]MBC6994037.1 SagB/ThcOx family dehydrogenase [Neolewinella lacunae]MDN3634707.1 SagB/ThcOx family dehydrogenase [Neolewinella lacunae]
MDIHTLQHKKRYGKFDTGPYGLEKYADSQALIYHENSKLDRFLARRYGIGLARFDTDYFRQRSQRPYKVYPGAKRVSLTEYQLLGPPSQADYFTLLGNRRSERIYTPYDLSLRELFVLCHYTYGISRYEQLGEEEKVGFRYAPSGGGLYPLELYVALLAGDVELGLYHYRPDVEALERLKSGDFRSEVARIVPGAPFVDMDNCSAVFLVTSVAERAMLKYGDRGYRWILMETGAIAQNTGLSALALGLGSCLVGGFLDDEVNRFLGINGVSETVQKCIVIGKPADDDQDN